MFAGNTEVKDGRHGFVMPLITPWTDGPLVLEKRVFKRQDISTCMSTHFSCLPLLPGARGVVHTELPTLLAHTSGGEARFESGFVREISVGVAAHANVVFTLVAEMRPGNVSQWQLFAAFALLAFRHDCEKELMNEFVSVCILRRVHMCGARGRA